MITLIKTVLLLTALCADSFAAAVSIGSAGIKLPLRSAAVISFTGMLFLTCSVLFADSVKEFIPQKMCAAASFALLFALGLFNLFKGYFEKITGHRKSPEEATPADMFFDGAAADTDNSKSISAKEAAVLSAALSADSLIAGASAGLGETDLPLLCAGAFAAGLISVAAGMFVGRKVVSTLKLNTGALCGALLIILAFMKLWDA